MRNVLLGALAILLCGAEALGAVALPEIPPLPGAEAVDDGIAPLAVDAPLPDAVAAPVEAPLFPVPDLALDAPMAAAATAGGVALALAGFALYSRLSRSELLDHKRRDALVELVRASPGIALSDVAKRCGLAWGTVVYHLGRLEKAGFLVSERNAGRRCYFVATSVPRGERAGFGALQQGTTRSIAQFVAARPGATQSELCEELGLTASAASKQVSKLESAGLVRREREWKTVRLHPAPQLATVLAPA